MGSPGASGIPQLYGRPATTACRAASVVAHAVAVDLDFRCGATPGSVTRAGRKAVGPVGAYEGSIDILERELNGVLTAFDGVTSEQWALPTALEPLDKSLSHWTVFELAGHFDISIGLTRMLIADQQQGQVGRDRVSFFIFPRSEVAPVVYDYAYTMVQGKSPADMPGVLRETFTKTVEESRSTPPDTVGSG